MIAASYLSHRITNSIYHTSQIVFAQNIDKATTSRLQEVSDLSTFFGINSKRVGPPKRVGHSERVGSAKKVGPPKRVGPLKRVVSPKKVGPSKESAL